ncbi:DNA polymerase III subunit delta [Anaerohalosphaera lusitana]|uniref:DNA polymerase III subunit delta n=1 Tax=Anaerohalosphaera lusitana TaxID=1936003 RepID=A0A1U9NNY8_9BACT|nr:DNA polymerase III subunit delta [Anaerohalosphaera lusitana]AQT69507.1 DNA polymerase III subunit delta [Anaerohalosphaera lusitana]
MAKNKNKEVSCIYVICGKDAHLVGKQCESLVDSLLGDDERDMALFQPDPDKVDCVTVLDELRTVPFLASRRVVVLRGADKFITANRPLLERYFEEPSKSGVLVLVVSKWQKSTKLAKKLPKVGELIEVGDLKPAQLPGYAVERAKTEHSKTLDRDAAAALVEFVGDDPGKLASEVDKLAMYVDESAKISLDDVETLIGKSRAFNAFEVIDLITSGNTAGAVERLRNMFVHDPSAEYTAVGAFAYHMRKMFNAKVMIETGVPIRQVCGKLRIFGKNQSAFLTQIKKVGLAQLGSAIRELAHIDLSMKTGGMDGKVAIEQLVFKLGMTLKNR